MDESRGGISPFLAESWEGINMKKSIYGITSSGELFFGEITNWVINGEGFKHSQCQISIYYKYDPNVSKLVVLSYVYECVYWYIYAELEKWLWIHLEEYYMGTS